MGYIEITKKPLTQLFDCMRFVLKARAKESTRYAIGGIYITKKFMVATDGQRLHWTTLEHPEWDEGLYSVAKCTATHIILSPSSENGKFPKWQEVVPKHKEYFCGHSIEQVYMGLGQKGVAIHVQCLQDALSMDERADIYVGAWDRPIYVKGMTCHAVVMPINIEKVVYAKVAEPKPKTKPKKKHKK